MSLWNDDGPSGVRSMRTRIFALAAMLVGAAVTAPAARAVDSNDAAADVSLADRLKAGLRARRPEEQDFLDGVARLVDTGRLPRKLVDSTYVWAIRRRQDYPLPAFERALRLQSDRLGIDVSGGFAR